MAYNPFDKDIFDLEAHDLQTLITDQVREGYWVEYKGDVPSNPSIAKSIASFANTYGGWYFIGVIADRDHNVATQIAGFSLATTPDPLDKVRNIIKSHIDPTPVFFLQRIDISGDQAVFVAFIPGDQETPFITRDGRIYRRVSDSSEPVPEDNRYAVDRLVDQGRAAQDRFRRFCKDTRTFSEAEHERQKGWAHIYIAPHPHQLLEPPQDWHTASQIEALLQLSHESLPVFLGQQRYLAGNLPFNVGQMTTNSIILRQTNHAQIANNPLMGEFFRDGRVKLLIPLQYRRPHHEPERQTTRSQSVRTALQELASKTEDSALLLRFTDMELLWTQTMLLITYYQTWLSRFFGSTYPTITAYRYAITLHGMWRAVAFSDTDAWGTHVQTYGLPIVFQDILNMPSPLKSTPWIELPQEESLWLSILSQICVECGMTHDLVGALASAVVEQAQANSAS